MEILATGYETFTYYYVRIALNDFAEKYKNNYLVPFNFVII